MDRFCSSINVKFLLDNGSCTSFYTNFKTYPDFDRALDLHRRVVAILAVQLTNRPETTLALTSVLKIIRF